jgi:hypothetical protein
MVLGDVYLDAAVPAPAGGSMGLRAAFTNDASQPDRLVA